jgi:hypothetical protein
MRAQQKQTKQGQKNKESCIRLGGSGPQPVEKATASRTMRRSLRIEKAHEKSSLSQQRRAVTSLIIVRRGKAEMILGYSCWMNSRRQSDNTRKRTFTAIAQRQHVLSQFAFTVCLHKICLRVLLRSHLTHSNVQCADAFSNIVLSFEHHLQGMVFGWQWQSIRTKHSINHHLLLLLVCDANLPLESTAFRCTYLLGLWYVSVRLQYTTTRSVSPI